MDIGIKWIKKNNLSKVISSSQRLQKNSYPLRSIGVFILIAGNIFIEEMKCVYDLY